MSPEDFDILGAWNELAWKSGEAPNELECSRCGKLVSPSSLDAEQVCDECNEYAAELDRHPSLLYGPFHPFQTPHEHTRSITVNQ